MENISGSIGYTFLKNLDINRIILVLSDRHDKIIGCSPDSESSEISDWISENLDSSKILLEEVPRNKVVLEELWKGSSHTQNLKNLFLSNPEKITPVDIRPYLIEFSWELINSDPSYNLKLIQYFREFDNFMALKNNFVQSILKNYNVESLNNMALGAHFISIKNKYKLFIYRNKKFLKIDLIHIYNNNIEILEDFNDLLNDTMEWYICACIQLHDKPIILHTGLAHSEHVVKLLIQYYNYKIIESNGVNHLNDTHPNIIGCIQLPDRIGNLF